jgi:hypothetical protein
LPDGRFEQLPRKRYASDFRSAAALLDSDFEHPGEKKAVSKRVEEYLA